MERGRGKDEMREMRQKRGNGKEQKKKKLKASDENPFCPKVHERKRTYMD